MVADVYSTGPVELARSAVASYPEMVADSVSALSRLLALGTEMAHLIVLTPQCTPDPICIADLAGVLYQAMGTYALPPCPLPSNTGVAFTLLFTESAVPLSSPVMA